MTILQAILQGILQGLTIFLPISSNGVLSVYQHFAGTADQTYIFLVAMLRLGTVAAILAAFYNDILKLLKEVIPTLKEIFTGKFTKKTDNPYRKLLYMLFLASLPLFLLIPIRKWAQHFITDGDLIVEGILFILSSVFVFFACSMKKGRSGIQKMQPRSAISIGVAQALGIFPGVSRSGMSAGMGMMLGFTPSFAVKFSFLLAVPALLGNSIFQISDAINADVKLNFWVLFIGMLVAAIVGFVAIRLAQLIAKKGRYGLAAAVVAVFGVVVLIMGIVGAFSSKTKPVSSNSGQTSTSVSASADAEGQVSSGNAQGDVAEPTPEPTPAA